MRSAVFVLLSFSLCVPRLVRAEAPRDPLVEEGIRLRREHRDAEALDAFRRAYAENPSPRTQAQIALAAQALGQWVAAEKDLTEALGASEDAWIRAHKEALQEALIVIRKKLGTLAIDTNVKDGELWVGGSRVGALPVGAFRVVAGDVNVELRRPDHEPIRRTVHVPPEGHVSQTIEFIEPVAAPAPKQSDLLRESLPPPADPAVGQRTLAIGMLTGAGALLTLAIVAQVMHEESANHYNDDSLCLKAGFTRDQLCGVYRGRAEVTMNVAAVGYIGAGLLGVAGAVLLFTGSKATAAGSVPLWIEARPGGIYAAYAGKL